MVFTPAPRSPRLVSDLFEEVRGALLDDNANLYPNALMTRHYNRAVLECWHLMMQLGAEVAMSLETIVGDGAAQDYGLPSDFRAFVINKMLPRSPTTATSDYTWGNPLKHVGMLSSRLVGASTTVATPTAFATYHTGHSQYIRFDTIPPAGEYYDFQYYAEVSPVAVGNIGGTYTPWLGLIDSLLARILEEFLREGLEFITAKRDLWRAKTEGDLVMLLGLRHLDEMSHEPSLWKDFPQ